LLRGTHLSGRSDALANARKFEGFGQIPGPAGGRGSRPGGGRACRLVKRGRGVGISDVPTTHGGDRQRRQDRPSRAS